MSQPSETSSPETGEVATGTRQQQVADRLRDMIVTGQLDPDCKHSEAALAKRLGVSRTPVRHALAVLVEEGVMRRAGGRGYVVRRYEANDVAVALEIRSAVEGLAARSVARIGADARDGGHPGRLPGRGRCALRPRRNRPGGRGPLFADERGLPRCDSPGRRRVPVRRGPLGPRPCALRRPFGHPLSPHGPAERRLHLHHATFSITTSSPPSVIGTAPAPRRCSASTAKWSRSAWA